MNMVEMVRQFQTLKRFNNSPWTEEEILLGLTLQAQGYTSRQVAAQIGRSHTAVYRKIFRSGWIVDSMKLLGLRKKITELTLVKGGS